MVKLLRTTRFRYAAIGGTAGLLFSVVALIIELLAAGGTANAATVAALHASHPSLFVVHCAPFVLGAAAYLIGTRDERLQQVDATRETTHGLALQTTRAVLDTARGAIYLLDSERSIVEINEAGALRLGRRRSQLRGHCIDEFVTPAIATQHAMVVDNMMRGRTQWSHRSEYKNQVLLTSAYAVGEADGSATRVAFFTEDITAQTRVVDSLRRAKQLAEDASQSKSDFVSNMSHEIRTPLNGILGMLEMLLGTDLTDEQRDHADTARTAADALRVVVDSILDFSKLQANAIKVEHIACRPSEVAQAAVDIVSASNGKPGVELRCVIDDSVPDAVLADPFRIRQILLNLLSNAMKFTAHGHVCISVGVERETSNGHMLRFDVQDTGIGIAPEAQQGIFSAFSQADNSTTRTYGGTGLGLSICQQLATLMGGAISLVSEPGRGSTFSLRVECGATTSAVAHATNHDVRSPDAEGSAADRAASLSGGRLLVVDDNAINRKVAKAMLGKLGFEVELAINGSDAVDACARTQYDLVFMDCQMPVMSGYDATAAIRGLPCGADLPIIAMTAAAQSEVRDRCLDAGMDDYLAKPIGLQAIVDTLHRWLGRGLGGEKQAVGEREPEPAATDEAAVDVSKLDALCDMMGGDPSLLVELVDAFEHETPGECTAVADAVGRVDVDVVIAVAHKLRSSAGNMGATVMWQLCTELEAMGRRGDLKGADVLASQLIVAQKAAANSMRKIAIERTGARERLAS